MPVHTLQVGEELALDGGVRVAVLAVEGDTVWLGVTAPGEARAVAPPAPEGRTPRRAVLAAPPGCN